MGGTNLHVCALVAYDGTDFHGFQVQAGVPTVQGALEEALAACCGHFCRITGSGRTDTGVHAHGQVVTAQVPWRHGVDALQRAWNVHLPPSLVVCRLATVAAGFHPRFDARSRTYCYTVYHPVSLADGTAPRRFPLTDRFALYEPRPLDVEAMNNAVRPLLGEHDFLTFGQPPQGENSVRRLMRAEWLPVPADPSAMAQWPLQKLVFTVTANAFLRHMVRNLVGTLLMVGRRACPVEAVAQALAARDRGRCAPPAPAQGLVLVRVEYPEKWALFS